MFEPFPGNYIWNLSVNICIIGGGNIGEIDAANRPIIEAGKKGADAGTAMMFDSWVAMAEQVIANAEEDKAAGRMLSAGKKLWRAANYLLCAERMQARDYAPRWVCYQKGLDTYKEACELLGRSVEFVEIPYEGTTIPAIFVSDGSGEPRPTMLSCNGLDSMKEHIDMAFGDAWLERGMNVMFIDQPGTGQALRQRDLTARYDAEAWGTPAFDYLASRPDVISNKIGMAGLSLGGYYAPRVAANEPRFALCAVLGANHVWGERQKERLESEGENPVPHYWDHVQWVWGAKDMDEFMAMMPQVTLDGQIEKMKMPFLVTHGAGDRQIPVFNAHRSYEQAVNSSKRELKIFESATHFETEHCSADNGTVARDFIADWCAETFAEIDS